MSSSRRRLVVAAAAAVFVVGFVLLYLQSHNANERRTAANRSVRDNATRYANQIAEAAVSAPLTGSTLLALRAASFRNGGGLSQGIQHVGARRAGRSLTVTYQVQVDFRGSLHTTGRTLSCFRAVVSTASTRPTLSTLVTVDCADLLPPVAPDAVLIAG